MNFSLKNLTLFLLAAMAFFSCKKEPQAPVHVFPVKLYGFWVNEAYTEKLRVTGSPKAAQENLGLSVVQFFEKGGHTFVTTYWNFHEGGGVDTVFLTDAFSGMAYGGGTDTLRFELTDAGTLKVQTGKELWTTVQYADTTGSPEPTELIRNIVFEGLYTSEKEDITFNSNGTLTGPDSLTHYEPLYDYIGPGMQLDQVMLGNDAGMKPYGFAKTADGLEIFRLDCEVYDESGEYCESVKKGPVMFTLVKRK